MSFLTGCLQSTKTSKFQGLYKLTLDSRTLSISFPTYDQVHLTLGEFLLSYPTFDNNQSSQPSIGYTRLFQTFFLVGITIYLIRTTDPIGALEQYTGLEPVPPAWKAGMLAIEHQYCTHVR